MSNVISVVHQIGGQPVATFKKPLEVKAGTAASIKPGYLVIADGSNPGYVKAAPDATDTDSAVVGIASSESTETASLDGTVLVEAAPVLLVRLKAKTPGSLLATMKYTNKYILDVINGNYTLDQATTTKGLFRLLDFDTTTDGNCLASVACTLW